MSPSWCALDTRSLQDKDSPIELQAPPQPHKFRPLWQACSFKMVSLQMVTQNLGILSYCTCLSEKQSVIDCYYSAHHQVIDYYPSHSSYLLDHRTYSRKTGRHRSFSAPIQLGAQDDHVSHHLCKGAEKAAMAKIIPPTWRLILLQ